MKRECFLLKCKSERAKNRVRQYCQYHTMEFRTLGKTIVIYEGAPQIENKWKDVTLEPSTEIKDKIGNLAYL